MIDENKEQTEATQTESADKVFDKKIIKRWGIYFVLITLLSFAAIFFYSNTENTLAVVKTINPRYIALAFGMAMLDLALGGWRNHIFARVIVPGISFRVCFNANLANIFMGAVTPSQSGGGPAQLYVFARNGISLLNGLTISIINWFSTISFFPIAAFFSILLIKDRFSEQTLLYLLNFGFGLFLTLLSVVIIAFWKPIWVGQFLKRIGYWLGSFSPKWESKIIKWSDKTFDAIQSYQNSIKKMVFDNPHLVPYSFFMTLVLYFNKFCLAYILMLGLGHDCDFWVFIAIQVIIMFILYFAPSPGGSGIAEFSNFALMPIIMPNELVGVFTLMHRFFFPLLPAVLGSIVVTMELRRHAEE